ncbi:hypothetical protein bcere0029_21800 [Bacillus cereus AH1272]|uniref:hypothetical protein n=2 Tax=Bacillus nitratireducens TaxID=2026193 RepID=UPI0001A11028|nr:hypothetical protein [Bacillus nitratireducens]EEL87950.1 hypothetical protein bcere0029_21800 [Bacillus cereus AH1272]EEL93809.1 hypothetical protein bcere0030_21820 [Bacillus cereus AH1273]EOP55632.1 hypothetical protein IKQ_01847 [Bacillus cereus VDM053]GCF77538.1 hypothetical protein BC2926_50790 [Bacillus cereus]SEA59286.1 hypothetical protein SAMN04488146_1035 [Bacillus nitratireducens]
MLEKPMSMHNGYGKADPQEQEGIMTTSIDAEKLQDAISRFQAYGFKGTTQKCNPAAS